MHKWYFSLLFFTLGIPLYADETVTVDSLLQGWKKQTDVKTVDASITVRQLSKEGRWESEEPTYGRFRFTSSPLEARFDLLGIAGSTFLLSAEGILTETTAGQVRGRMQLDHNSRLRSNLWLGDLPAFMIVGIDPEKIRYQYQIKVVPDSKKGVTIYLYPQRDADQRRFNRMEVLFVKATMKPVQIHVIWKDGHHTFFAILETKTDVALDQSHFILK